MGRRPWHGPCGGAACVFAERRPALPALVLRPSCFVPRPGTAEKCWGERGFEFPSPPPPPRARPHVPSTDGRRVAVRGVGPPHAPPAPSCWVWGVQTASHMQLSVEEPNHTAVVKIGQWRWSRPACRQSSRGDEVPTTKFPVTTTSTLILHMDSGIRARSAPEMAVRGTRNATRSGHNGVKTRSALTAGKVADFPDRAEFINAQSSRFQICAIAL